ncbi:MAG: sulfotransferase, partial [Myxococcota bacterium]
GTVERIYATAGQPFGEDTRRGIERYRADHQRGRKGRIDYRLDAFGIDAQERRQALRFYSERFGVPDA